MHRIMMKDLKDVKDKGRLKSEISYIAHNYTFNYKPTKSTLNKHRILKRLKNNNNIVILRPDKGSGVVILNKIDYINMVYEVVNDKSKFIKLKKDLAVTREGQLQRYLSGLRKNKVFTDIEYKLIYPGGSDIGKMYGLPKTHKLSNINKKLKVRPIISSIDTYNYGLAKYLCVSLTKLIVKISL